MNIIKDIDIILLSQFRWDGQYSSISIAMAKEFAKTNRVFFLNHPNTLRDLGPIKGINQRKTWAEPVEGFDNRLIIVEPPAMLPINFLSDNLLYRKLARRNAAKLEQSVQDIIGQFSINQYVFINCFDPFYPVCPKVHPKPLLNIYQCVDNIAESEYLKKHGPRLEAHAIAQADLCLVTSSELKRLKKAYNPNTKVLHNAADVSLFNKALDEKFELPKELANRSGKIIGFIGNLDQTRIDYALLKEVAKSHSDKTLLLIGPVNNTIAKKIGLMDLPNVIFAGGKKIEALPAYLHYMDCALIPFNCNDLTKSIYPLKINEYLAAGKPVISTPFSEDIHAFRKMIYLADTSTQFIKAIEVAMQEDSPQQQQQRRQFAEKNSWTGRVQEFWDIVAAEITIHT